MTMPEQPKNSEQLAADFASAYATIHETVAKRHLNITVDAAATAALAIVANVNGFKLEAPSIHSAK
jgi:hypothetical protein